LSLGTITNISESNWLSQIELFQEAFQLGINSFDTAPHYNDNKGELFLGELLQDFPRKEVLVSTKVYYEHDFSFGEKGLSRKHIFNSVNKSLEKIGTDYIDVLYFHRYDSTVKLEESILAVSELIKDGKIKRWGWV
jgi:aryl-alcohol dehydrogenase-like predicted oxidoreductase